ncbi:hypothetical protein EKI60_04950 [Candidatus Saccharibacteria bacterium]|nr:MAG: hypothetical protein EKI60_04950 [Candidatus Saccharibacteria bacterium]
MSELLLTQEVGSLAKPDWRISAVRDGVLTDAHIADAVAWAERLGIDPDWTDTSFHRYQEWLRCGDPTCNDGAITGIKDDAARFAVALQETAGIDIVYDGEQDRSEMYEYAVARTNGFDWRGRVRAFDNKSYRKAAVVSDVSPKEPWHEWEVARLQDNTTHPIKVPITGAYTLAAWSYDEHYGDRRQFVGALARDVIRPNIEQLLEAGVEWIQIDEPAATTVPEEVGLFVESFNEATRDLIGKFSVHICFSDYSRLFPYVSELENCDQFSLEFANRDGRELGTDKAQRPAYKILGQLAEYCPDASVGLGVTSVHDDILETPQLVRDRVLRAVDIIGDPAKVFPSPDCGLRTRSWDVAFDKLRVTSEGTALARQALGV